MIQITEVCLQLRLLFFSVNSTEPNSLPDQPVSLSYDQSQGGADETNALVVDKITEILEETFEKKVVVDSSNLGNTDHLQDIVAESMQGIPQSGGMCSLASASGENGGSGDPVIVQEAHLGKVSQVTKPYQVKADSSYMQIPFFLHADDSINILLGSYLQCAFVFCLLFPSFVFPGSLTVAFPIYDQVIKFLIIVIQVDQVLLFLGVFFSLSILYPCGS